MAPLLRLTILAVACACASAQYAEERAPRYIASESKPAPPPPVAILKQINKHNEDGSYTYGYEGADGSFKIETKSPTGDVKGKYGYKDDTGKVRVVEYGANKFGFQPAGEGITVAPPTLVDETREESRPGKSQANRSQYRAQPAQQAVDYDYEEPAPAPRPRPAPQQQYRPQPQQQQYRPAPQAAPAPPRPIFIAGAAPAPAPELSRQSFFNPAPAQQPRQQQYKPRPQPAIEYSQNFGPPQQQSFAPQATEARYSAPQQSAPQQFPQQFNQQQFNQPRQQPFSMLDQLLKEYALPEGGSPALHDITFGSY